TATGASVSLLDGLLIGRGDFTFRSRDVEVDLDGDAVPDAAHLLTFAVTNAIVAIGSAVYGVTFTGDFAVADLTPDTAPTDTREWAAVEASNLAGSLVLGALAS